MSVEENKAILKKYFEEFNKRNIDVVDELVSPDFIRHTGRGGTKTVDLEGLKEQFEEIFREEGWICVLDDMIAEGDRIAWWVHYEGGKYDGHSWCLIDRFYGGKIVESWNMTAIQKPPKA